MQDVEFRILFKPLSSFIIYFELKWNSGERMSRVTTKEETAESTAFLFSFSFSHDSSFVEKQSTYDEHPVSD